MGILSWSYGGGQGKSGIGRAADAFPHLYAFGLDAERLKYLLDRLPEALSNSTRDIESFCRFLSIAAEQDSKEQEI
jgi:hypothetical protein